MTDTVRAAAQRLRDLAKREIWGTTVTSQNGMRCTISVNAGPDVRALLAALAAERQARQDAERELAEAVERGQNLVDGIGMEREMRRDAEAALADARRALERIDGSQPPWKAAQIARAALASLPGEPRALNEPEGVDERSSPGSSSDAPGTNYPGVPASSGSLSAQPGEPPPPSEPRVMRCPECGAALELGHDCLAGAAGAPKE